MQIVRKEECIDDPGYVCTKKCLIETVGCNLKKTTTPNAKAETPKPGPEASR